MEPSRRPDPWLPPTWAFTGFRFPPEVIVVAIRWYLRFNLSYRDVEELLVERGVQVDHVTVCRWVQRFTPLLADAARFCRHSPGDRWYIDETYVRVNAVWRYVYRAVDQYGQVIDVQVSTRRDANVAHRRHLDLGGDIGALIVHTGPDRQDDEIEIAPVTGNGAGTHAEVRERRLTDMTVYCAIYHGLAAGNYTVAYGAGLNPTVTITGGAVTELQPGRARLAGPGR